MWSSIKNNWLLATVIVLALVAVFLLLVYYMTKWTGKPPTPLEDAIYYQVTDIDGNKSIIHDSGIKPSKYPPGSNFNLQILKREINNSQETILNTPDYLHLGHSPKNLSYKLGVDAIYLNDEGLYYTLLVVVPLGKDPAFPFSYIKK